MTFAQAEEYLLSTIGEIKSPRMPYRLDRMRTLLRALGDPQDRYPTIHVGGTSGKGSTATMMAAALTAAGKRTGLHTKPHLRSMVERARIDGQPIDENRFAELLGEMLPSIEAVTGEFGRPTYYETILALTFLYFEREAVDAALIEVGIGGKLDGTNVLKPRISIITNIGLDHTDILGDTIEAIAADKAGIAKPGVPLVSAVEQPSARAIIESACAQAGAPFVWVFEAAAIDELPAPPLTQAFEARTARAKYQITLPVLGAFQQRNAATAIVALEKLDGALRPSREAIESGLARVHIPGRMEYFPGHPPVIFDVAHNPDKAANLAASLHKAFRDRRFTFVLAISTGKDAAEILRALAPTAGSFIFTTFETPGRNAEKPSRLASIAEDIGLWGRAIQDPVDALSIARRHASIDEIVVVTGSTFVVARLREWWMENVIASESAH